MHREEQRHRVSSSKDFRWRRPTHSTDSNKTISRRPASWTLSIKSSLPHSRRALLLNSASLVVLKSVSLVLVSSLRRVASTRSRQHLVVSHQRRQSQTRRLTMGAISFQAAKGREKQL